MRYDFYTAGNDPKAFECISYHTSSRTTQNRCSKLIAKAQPTTNQPPNRSKQCSLSVSPFVRSFPEVPPYDPFPTVHKPSNRGLPSCRLAFSLLYRHLQSICFRLSFPLECILSKSTFLLEVDFGCLGLGALSSTLADLQSFLSPGASASSCNCARTCCSRVNHHRWGAKGFERSRWLDRKRWTFFAL